MKDSAQQSRKERFKRVFEMVKVGMVVFTTAIKHSAKVTRKFHENMDALTKTEEGIS